MRQFTVTCSDPDIAGAAYGCHEIEAEAMTTGPAGELVFLVGGKPSQVFAPGAWAHAKAEDAEGEDSDDEGGYAFPARAVRAQMQAALNANAKLVADLLSSAGEERATLQAAGRPLDDAIAAVAAQYKGVRSPVYDVDCVCKLVREDLAKFRRVIAPYMPKGVDAAQFEQDVINRASWLSVAARQTPKANASKPAWDDCVGNLYSGLQIF